MKRIRPYEAQGIASENQTEEMTLKSRGGRTLEMHNKPAIKNTEDCAIDFQGWSNASNS